MWKIINNRKKNNANGGSKEKLKKICQLTILKFVVFIVFAFLKQHISN